jgi:predicted nucleic acid-binding protein
VSFIIDTDICSAHLKQGGKVSNRFLQYTGGLHISTITLAELSTWALRADAPPKRLQVLQEMLSDVKILEVTIDVAEKFGQLQASLLDAGKPAPAMDLLIAATALVHDLTLVTHNAKDYVNISDLRIVDWLTA